MSINIKKYLVFYTPGSAGNFLGAVLQMYLTGYRESFMSTNGDMHDSNRSNISAMHESCKLEIIKNFPKAKSVVITCDTDDIGFISTMHFYKQLKPNWNIDIYNLLPSSSTWPDFNKGVDDPMIKQGLVDVISIWAQKWTNTDTSLADCIIPFKTVLGLNDTSLNEVVSNFLNMPPDKEINNFIIHYQTYNKNLYASSTNN